MIIHWERKAKELEDGICVDCQYFYECNARPNAEARGNSVTECSTFKKEGQGNGN